jgi:hypothetical protein
MTQDIPFWSVEYTDGAVVSELGEPETPFRAIDWPRVARLVFESNTYVTVYDIAPVAPPLQYRLMRRRIVQPQHGDLGIMLLVCESPTGPQSVFYWLPDASTHHCLDLDCPDVRQYAAQLLAGTPCTLAETH